MSKINYQRCIECVILCCLLGLNPINSTAVAQPHERIRDSLVRIEINAIDNLGKRRSRLGNGFVVSKDGQVLTANHLISDLGSIITETLQIDIHFGRQRFPLSMPAVLLNSLPSVDLMLLKVSRLPKGYQPVDLQTSYDLPPGIDVYTSYFFLGPDQINAYQVFKASGHFGGTERGTSLLSLRLPFLGAEASGAPIYLRNGRVIGILTGYKQAGAAVFTPIDRADPLLVSLQFRKIKELLSQLNQIKQRMDPILKVMQELSTFLDWRMHIETTGVDKKLIISYSKILKKSIEPDIINVYITPIIETQEGKEIFLDKITRHKKSPIKSTSGGAFEILNIDSDIEGTWRNRPDIYRKLDIKKITKLDIEIIPSVKDGDEYRLMPKTRKILNYQQY